MFEFRQFTEADFPQMLEWLLKDHVREWWDEGEHSLEKVVSNYAPEEGLERFILVETGATGERPVGFFQYYELPDDIIGIDQFIGDENYIDRGIGTETIRLFTDMIWKKRSPSSIILDPLPENKRAIRCYEKVGFRYYETMQNADGTRAYMMRLERSR
jgi:RimJ/RimL family protein N-acetyltransferase